MSYYNTTRVQDNEVVKAEDYNYAFDSLFQNFALSMNFLFSKNVNVVIGGTVKASSTSGMYVSIDPIFTYCKTAKTNIYQFTGNDEITDLIDLNPADTSSDRIDIIEVCGIQESYDEQQRALNDPETNVKTYPFIYIKNRIKLSINVKKGEAGSLVAPETTEGYVKLAEIHIAANTTTISDSDIYNVTSDSEGIENTGWTTEKSSTINFGTISDINNKLRLEHNADGTHKDAVIHAANVDFGTGSTQVNGTKMPIGGSSVTFGTETITSEAKLSEVLSKLATGLSNELEKYSKINLSSNTAYTGDCNSLNAGVYLVDSTATNSPGTTDSYILESYYRSDDCIVQIAYAITDGTPYVRNKTSSGWTSWNQIISKSVLTSTLSSYAKSSVLGDQVTYSLSGDTLTITSK